MPLTTLECTSSSHRSEAEHLDRERPTPEQVHEPAPRRTFATKAYMQLYKQSYATRCLCNFYLSPLCTSNLTLSHHSHDRAVARSPALARSLPHPPPLPLPIMLIQIPQRLPHRTTLNSQPLPTLRRRRQLHPRPIDFCAPRNDISQHGQRRECGIWVCF